MKKKDNHPKPTTIMIAQLIKTNSTLSTTIARQDVRIDNLKEHIEHLKDKVEEVQDDWNMADEYCNKKCFENRALKEENDWLKNKVDWDSNNYSEPDGRLH